MELDNKTPYPAHFYRTALAEDRFAASVLVRVTFDLADGALAPSEEQPWITSRAPWKSPQGEMESDALYYREGCDLFVFGSARAPRGEPVRELDVGVTVGDFSRTVRVFGDRVWEGASGQLTPSEPQLFEEMPLALSRSFGGVATWDELDVPFNDNPEGRGFYVEEDDARDHPLPNLEEVDQLVKTWTDRPEPAGLGICPRAFGPRLRRGATFGGDGAVQKIHAALFNAAFPRMIAPRVEPGMDVTISGVRADGPLRFTVPSLALVLRVRFGDDAHDEPLEIDQMGIEVDEARVFLSYRYAFRYVMTPGRERSCTVSVRS